MGRPAKACRLCPRSKGVTVADCEDCHNRFCVQHIVFHNPRMAWLCDRCLRKEQAQESRQREREYPTG